jgi:hypothetical protein
MTSYFAKANYNYADKYLFSATVRRDASSVSVRLIMPVFSLLPLSDGVFQKKTLCLKPAIGFQILSCVFPGDKW